MTGDGKNVASLVNKAKSISLIIHERPDGDAIGSAWALYHILSGQKNTEVVCTSSIDPIFEKTLGKLPVQRNISSDSDLIILLDCSELHRTGLENEIKSFRRNKKKVIAIDHHAGSSLAKHVDEYLHDCEASSTAELLYECIGTLRAPITSAIANSLLLGIYTDTGGFRHPNTSSKTLKIASRLVSCGAHIEHLATLFGEQRTIPKTKLWGAAFSQVKINRMGIAIIKIDQKMMAEHGATEADVAGLSNNLSLLSGARAALVMIETGHGWRGSLRTRHRNIDLRRLASYFGGRGTKKATGFLTTNDLF